MTSITLPDEAQPVDFTARSVAWLVDVCGVAANPSNPFGRSRLALHRTRAVLDNQGRTSTRRRFTCRVSPDLLTAVVEHLRRGGFPAVPREPLSPGSLRSLFLKRAEGELSTGLSLHTRADGYADAFAALDALAFHLSGGALASTPRVSLAALGPAREVDLEARARPDRPPFDDEADAVLEHAREIARDCQHEDVLPAHVLAYVGQSAYRYVLDRAGCDAAAIGAAADLLLPADGGTDEDTDPGPGEELCEVESEAASIAAGERAPEATLRHLVLALLRAPSLSEALRPFAIDPARFRGDGLPGAQGLAQCFGPSQRVGKCWSLHAGAMHRQFLFS